MNRLELATALQFDAQDLKDLLPSETARDHFLAHLAEAAEMLRRDEDQISSLLDRVEAVEREVAK